MLSRWNIAYIGNFVIFNDYGADEFLWARNDSTPSTCKYQRNARHTVSVWEHCDDCRLFLPIASIEESRCCVRCRCNGNQRDPKHDKTRPDIERRRRAGIEYRSFCPAKARIKSSCLQFSCGKLGRVRFGGARQRGDRPCKLKIRNVKKIWHERPRTGRDGLDLPDGPPKYSSPDRLVGKLPVSGSLRWIELLRASALPVADRH